MKRIQFDKYGKGLRQINQRPDFWKIEEEPITFKHGRKAFRMFNFADNSKLIVESYLKEKGALISISLIRLSDITEEDALCTAVEKTEKGFRHYCPEKLFPKEILKDQDEGYPFMENARSSYFTLWVKKYGQLDSLLNPWIWRYEFEEDECPKPD